MKQYSLKEIAEHIGAEIIGDGSVTIKGIAPLQSAGAEQISFFDNKRYREQLKVTQAAAVILKAKDAKDSNVVSLIVADPYVGFAKATALFSQAPVRKVGVHPTVIIGDNCHIDASVSIGAYTVIEDNVTIGADSYIGSHCRIDQDVSLGEHCDLKNNVTIYYGCKVGSHVKMYSGVVIGADGFGFANDKGQWVKVHQLGAVTIGNHVDIGANSCIDRGALDDTKIGSHVIIDNQVQLGHNVEVGDGSAIAGCTGIAGSTKIGKYCMIGGHVAMNGHIELCDHVSIVGGSAVLRSIEKPGAYASPTTEMPVKQWLKTIACYHKLPEWAQHVQKLEKFLNDGSEA
tara:strand:- start:52830 stop:53861 length:1032 start_codon:yes stop_codon:yes gene_type:complete